jgi:hypothetical protein
MIGPSSGNNKGQVLQLISGVLTMGDPTGSLPGYALDGTATLVVQRHFPTVILSADSTLTVASGADLVNLGDIATFLSESEDGAKIVLEDSTSSITYFGGTHTPSLSGVSFIPGTYTYGASWTGSGYRVTGPLVLVYNEISDTWVKQ